MPSPMNVVEIIAGTKRNSMSRYKHSTEMGKRRENIFNKFANEAEKYADFPF